MVAPGVRHLWMAALLSAAACILSASAKDAVSGPVQLADPTVMPYSCPKGEPLQDCTGQPLCSQKQCGRGYRCIESYCGTCQATCVENLSPAQCNSTKFMPVCGKDGKTYGDVCHARRIGVGLACRGPCKSTENSCTCDLEYSPVCGSDKQYYINKCVAELCAAVKTAPDAECTPQETPDPGCICPFIYSPVCGVNGKTYSNACIAACAYVRVAYDGECGCKKFKDPCVLADPHCCPGLDCIQFPVVRVNATMGVCWNMSLPHPIG